MSGNYAERKCKICGRPGNTCYECISLQSDAAKVRKRKRYEHELVIQKLLCIKWRTFSVFKC